MPIHDTDPQQPDATADRLRVFISYARSDASDFAEYLVVALKLSGFDAYLDRHDIAKAEDWEQRLGELIGQSDTVVFVISPAAMRSARCQWEVERASAFGKRVVPLQWIAVPEADVPASLRRLNYTVFSSGHPFAGPLEELKESLRQDLGWLRQQTKLSEEAQRWNAQRRDEDLLLRGSTLKDARAWMANRRPNAPEIAPLVALFIGTSEDAEAARSTAEHQRLMATARAQADREQALAAAEASRRLRSVVVGASFVIVSAFAGWALLERSRAVESAAVAERSAQEARRQALVARANESLAEQRRLEAIDTIGWLFNESFQLEPNRVALSGTKLDLLEGMVQRLRRTGYEGRIMVAGHLGLPIVVGHGDEIGVDPCVTWSGPKPKRSIRFWPESRVYALALAQRQAEALTRQLTKLGVSQGQVETVSYGIEKVKVPYPFDITTKTVLTADECKHWNAAALQNNRLEIRLQRPPSADAERSVAPPR